MDVDIKHYLSERYGIANINDLLETFVTFMIDNDWFNEKPKLYTYESGRTIIFEDGALDKFAERFNFYLLNKDLDVVKKVELLHSRLSAEFPKTSVTLCKYLTNESNWNVKLNIYDFLIAHLTKEVFYYSNDEIELLIASICNEITLSAGQRFVDFLFQTKRNHKVAYTNDFILESRNTESRVKEAYSFDTFQRLSYYLFNPDYICENDMIEAACDSIHTTNLWLYLATHMICALRDTDLEEFPHPRLFKQPDEIIEMIRTGQFSDKDAKSAAMSVSRQLNYLSKQPNKTSRYNGISDVKFIIPESALSLFGTLYALKEAQLQSNNEGNTPLITPVRDYERISRYLGDDIGSLFLENDFSVRSSNKTYMQAIDFFADDILDAKTGQTTHAKGYILAALARSHKGSYGEFARTTEMYLKDAKFSGYSPEFIAFQLFERGVLSFIPSMLLKIVTNGDFDNLAIQQQTELVKELGLTPFKVESLVSFCEKTIKTATKILNDIKLTFHNNDDLRSFIMKILHNIANGRAVSKQDECLCLITAMEIKCKYPKSKQCIGCDYELSTKSTIFILMSEYNRIISLREKTEIQQLRNKYTLLLKDIIMPAISEIFTCIKENYGENATDEIEILMREMQNGN